MSVVAEQQPFIEGSTARGLYRSLLINGQLFIVFTGSFVPFSHVLA